MAQIAADRVESVAVPTANPAPLGLSAFALTTFVFVSWHAHLIVAPNVVLGLALFYGGLVQIIAGIQEFKAGNTFGATAFCSYGGFWLAVGSIFIPAFGVVAAYTKVADFHTALGFFLLGWTIFTFLMLIGTLRSNLALIAVFLLLFLTFLALTISELTGGGGTFEVIGGWLGILTALAAWYTALAGLLSSGRASFTLPVFPRS
ncbi:MAG: acetate uptake transporter [Chloroflexota bacterium]|nr:acetate uptake transporter [Chloroflexota bacterium]